jgi:hypothetical protein
LDEVSQPGAYERVQARRDVAPHAWCAGGVGTDGGYRGPRFRQGGVSRSGRVRDGGELGAFRSGVHAVEGAARSQYVTALCGTVDAYRGSGSYGAAAENYDRAHRLATEIEAPYLSGKALYGMAETVLVTQGLGAAKIYWRQAHDIFARLGVQEAAIVELRLHAAGATAS